MKINTTFFACISIFILLMSCGQENKNEKNNSDSIIAVPENKNAVQPVQQQDSAVLKIFVHQSGIISADGHDISLSDLENELQVLQSKNGTVYYSRENGTGDPPDQAMQVINLVAKYGRPMRFYTDETFTQPAAMR